MPPHFQRLIICCSEMLVESAFCRAFPSCYYVPCLACLPQRPFLHGGSLYIKLFYLFIQGLSMDSQQAGGLVLIAFGAPERIRNVSFFQRFKGVFA